MAILLLHTNHNFIYFHIQTLAPFIITILIKFSELLIAQFASLLPQHDVLTSLSTLNDVVTSRNLHPNVMTLHNLRRDVTMSTQNDVMTSHNLRGHVMTSHNLHRNVTTSQNLHREAITSHNLRNDVLTLKRDVISSFHVDLSDATKIPDVSTWSGQQISQFFRQQGFPDGLCNIFVQQVMTHKARVHVHYGVWSVGSKPVGLK